MIQSFRALLISALDDENGVSQETYDAFIDFADTNSLNISDICRIVESANNRIFLNEDHGLVA